MCYDMKGFCIILRKYKQHQACPVLVLINDLQTDFLLSLLNEKDLT